MGETAKELPIIGKDLDKGPYITQAARDRPFPHSLHFGWVRVQPAHTNPVPKETNFSR